jgi:hypothetical protein
LTELTELTVLRSVTSAESVKKKWLDGSELSIVSKKKLRGKMEGLGAGRNFLFK